MLPALPETHPLGMRVTQKTVPAPSYLRSSRATPHYGNGRGAYPGHNSARQHDVLGFLLDALTVALSEDMPPARRELVYTTSEVIRELVAA